MAIYNGLRRMTMQYGSRAISQIYYGLRLVYTGIRSCFGSGTWVDERPWLDGDSWKNSNR